MKDMRKVITITIVFAVVVALLAIINLYFGYDLQLLLVEFILVIIYLVYLFKLKAINFKFKDSTSKYIVQAGRNVFVVLFALVLYLTLRYSFFRSLDTKIHSTLLVIFAIGFLYAIMWPFIPPYQGNNRP